MSGFRRMGNDEYFCELVGENYHLFKSGDDGWQLQHATSGVCVNLEGSEVNAAFVMGQRPSSAQDRLLSAAGLTMQESSDEAAIEKLRRQVEDGAVLLDSTTLNNAEMAIEYPTALSLLDLSVVTFALVMCDRILFQSGSNVPTELLGLFPKVLKPLRYDNEFSSGLLWTICSSLQKDLGRGSLKEAIEERWQNFLSNPEIELNMGVVDHAQDSPVQWDGVPATYYHTLSWSSGGKSLNDFLSVQTIRALFNDNLAGMIGVPYLATSVRAPVVSELLERKVETRILADSLLARIGPEQAAKREEGSYVSEISAPFLTGVILSRIGSSREYWQAVGDLRDDFEPLRKRISRDRDEWDGRSGAYLRKYVDAVNGHVPESVKVTENMLSATAAFGVSIATGSPLGGGIGKLALKLVFATKPSKWAYKWCLQRFKPNVAIGIELAEEAKNLRNIDTEIRRVWGTTWSRQERDMLETLSLARADSFSKLRGLG